MPVIPTVQDYKTALRNGGSKHFTEIHLSGLFLGGPNQHGGGCRAAAGGASGRGAQATGGAAGAAASAGGADGGAGPAVPPRASLQGALVAIAAVVRTQWGIVPLLLFKLK